MKRTHWGILTVVLVGAALGIVAACDQGKTPTEVAPPATPVLVVDDVNHSITLTDEANPQKPLSIRVDAATRTQYMDCGDFHVVSGDGWLAEYTSQDYLEFSFEDLGNGRHVERFYFNGRVLELEIDDLGGPTPEQYQQFLEFFPSDPAANSLAYHPDGELMARILTRSEPGLARMIQGRAPDGQNYPGGSKTDDLPEMQLRPKWADIGCGMAGICSSIACKIVPFANPFCWACTAAIVVCVIMEMFGWW